jgi:hypothetical protein
MEDGPLLPVPLKIIEGVDDEKREYETRPETLTL